MDGDTEYPTGTHRRRYRAPARPVAVPGLGPHLVAAFAHAGPDDDPVIDLTLDEAALAPVVRGHGALASARHEGAVYGLTTGVGALRHVAVAEDDSVDLPGTPPPMTDEEAPGGVGVRPHGNHTLRLWRSHAAGLGPELDEPTARAAMLIRLHQLLRGSSGVHPALVEALALALRTRAVPSVRPMGAIGTSDLSGLAQLGLTLVGELPWRSGGIPAAPAVSGDGLPFLSSSAVTTAVGSLAVRRLVGLSRTAEAVGALSHLALRGAAEAYDARVHAGKDDPEAVRVAARMRHLLGLDDPGVRREHSRLQDPFSLRSLPQVHAPLVEAIAAAERALTAEIGAAAENPILVDVSALHHGQFHTQRLAAALDATRAATYAVLALSTSRTSALLNPDLTGLRAFLAAGPADSSGLMIVEYVAADLLARARGLTLPTSTGHAVVSLGLEEHASFSTQGALATDDLSRLTSDLLGVELLTAVRALRIAPERLADCPARRLYEEAAAVLPAVDEDHVLGPGLRAAAQLVRDHSDQLADA
ncbi:aromatic amino acid ammonia-lyase [uncultured Nocardioides sp.]|uniref:aromatic amino acid ammonia-lyase n=1 Tax=uncultured Nocardioides sp. TaxID=198441 RepID=UPI002603372B|nr:aromatic amino acid ammonia-lyase [uncultured Nocardioides sp.]